jgi:hypothetical protein
MPTGVVNWFGWGVAAWTACDGGGLLVVGS